MVLIKLHASSTSTAGIGNVQLSLPRLHVPFYCVGGAKGDIALADLHVCHPHAPRIECHNCTSDKVCSIVQMVHKAGSVVYSEVEAASTLLKFHTTNAGCCKVYCGCQAGASALNGLKIFEACWRWWSKLDDGSSHIFLALTACG